MVVLALLGIGWSLDQVFDAVSENNIEPDTYLAIFTLVDKHLASVAEPDWPSSISQLRTELNIPLALEPLSSIVSSEGDEEQTWPDSGIVTFEDVNGDTMMRRINHSDFVLSIGPIGVSRKNVDIEYILTAVFYISLAVTILLWVWPLWASLRSLSEVTSRFGQGKFHVRVNVAAKSMIAPLADTFNNMAIRIQKLVESHKELTNAVSHDLRTPLARMRFGIDMLGSHPNETDKQRYINSMQTDIDELDYLINEMLTYATFEREQPDLHMQTIQFVPWIEQIVEKLPSLNSNISVEINTVDCSADRCIDMEPRYLQRVLNNLLTNASRYAVKKILVSVVEETHGLHVRIEDDGPGIPEKDRDIIFEAFKKSDSVAGKNQSGFGLGLAIVYKIIEWHGGSVRITDSSLGGACFDIEFPNIGGPTVSS